MVHFDRGQLAVGRAVRVTADAPSAVAQISCGQIARSQWAVIVDADSGEELPDGHIGEIWLHGENIGRGYWGPPRRDPGNLRCRADIHSRWSCRRCTGKRSLASHRRPRHLSRRRALRHRPPRGSRGDRRATALPQDIETTTAEAASLVRRGHATAFTVPDEQLVIIAERASGTRRADPAPGVDAIRAAVLQRHGIVVADVRFIPAGAIPCTTSGKLARRACRAEIPRGNVARSLRVTPAGPGGWAGRGRAGSPCRPASSASARSRSRPRRRRRRRGVCWAPISRVRTAGRPR